MNKSAVDVFVDVWLIMVALALTTAVIGLVSAGSMVGTIQPTLPSTDQEVVLQPTTGVQSGTQFRERLPLFIAFAVTLLAFMHGTVRNVREYYARIDWAVNVGARYSFAVEVLTVLVHGVLFFCMALSLCCHRDFAWALLILLLTDVVYGVLFINCLREPLKTDDTESVKDPPHVGWVLLNALAALFVLLLVIGEVPFVALGGCVDVVLLIACGRTLLDYYVSREFYFGAKPDTPPTSTSPTS